MTKSRRVQLLRDFLSVRAACLNRLNEGASTLQVAKVGGAIPGSTNCRVGFLVQVRVGPRVFTIEPLIHFGTQAVRSYVGQHLFTVAVGALVDYRSRRLAGEPKAGAIFFPLSCDRSEPALLVEAKQLAVAAVHSFASYLETTE